MSEKIHLPEDIADTESKAGQKPITQSYPFVLAEDELVGYASVFPPTSPAEMLNPIYRPASENVTDVFALGRQVKSFILFRNVSNYDFDNQWGSQLSDTTDGGTMPEGSEAIVWTERINTRASYPGSLTEVNFVPGISALQLRNYPVNSNIGYQQTVLYSNRVFSASANPIMVTVAVSMTLSDNPNCSKTWGLFGGNSGYFFRIYGKGLADSFEVGYRRTLGGTTEDIEIPRSQFNGDKLDGTNGHTQTFTNVGMFGIEVATAGAGARFWAYVTVADTARWVLVHTLTNDSDSSQDRITDEEGLPISFEVKNVGQSTTLQTLSKYGTSVTSLGTPIGTTDINSARTSKLVSPSRSPFPILGIRAKDFINNRKNFSNILATEINILVTSGIWRIVLIKNPVKETNSWSQVSDISAIQINTNRNSFVNRGFQVGQYFVSASKPLNINLEDLFALNRTFLTAQYSNDAQATGDFGQQFLQNSDELWVCAVDASIPFSNNEVIWESLVNVTATYEFSSSSSANSPATVYANINVLEV